MLFLFVNCVKLNTQKHQNVIVLPYWWNISHIDSVYQFISLSFFILNLYWFLHFWSIIHVIECLLSVSQLEKSYFILILIRILFLDFVLSFWDIITIKHLWLSQVLLNTNKMAPAVTLLTCTLEVPGSNLDYGTTNPYWGFSWFSLVP